MPPALPAGMILQNRYCLVKELGMGGFGRTYLAENKDRFNELCVVKEYIPYTGDGDCFLEKSQELFQREAAVLYQIEHPQIPKFLATFEQGKRLFLVQEYIEGKSYGQLLEESPETRRTFSQLEVAVLLSKMLPVLEYLHSRGILHRDISPDNLICRTHDHQPVLIDFGAVKQGIAASQSLQKTEAGTTVGKLGYAPPEQLQTGTVYPNSDLYSLGVTAAVLLTGRKPQDLLDEETLTWRWVQWVPGMNRGFAMLLNRMMSRNPKNRYQSAQDIVQPLCLIIAALQQPPTAAKPLKSRRKLVNQPHPVPLPNLILLLITVLATPVRNDPKTMGVVVATGILFIILAPFVLFNEVLQTVADESLITRPPSPVSPIAASPSPIAALSLTPLPPPVTHMEELSLAVDVPVTQRGSVKANENLTYRVAVQEKQQLNVVSGTPGVKITVWLNSRIVDETAQNVSQWEGLLPSDGYCYIQLNVIPGVLESEYDLKVRLTPAAESQTASQTAS